MSTRLVWRSFKPSGEDYYTKAGTHYGALFSFARSYSTQDLRDAAASYGARDVVVQEKGTPGPYTIAWPNETDDSRRIVYVEATPAKDFTVPISLPWPVHKFDVLAMWEQVSETYVDPPTPPPASSYVRAVVAFGVLAGTVTGLLWLASRGKIRLGDPPLA